MLGQRHKVLFISRLAQRSRHLATLSSNAVFKQKFQTSYTGAYGFGDIQSVRGLLFSAQSICTEKRFYVVRDYSELLMVVAIKW